MILSLATDKLDDEGITNITNIIERVSRLNKKRNALVHGWWTLEVVVVHSLKRGAIIYPNFLREIVPATNKLRSNISNIKNQKDRAAHCFNYKRIIATARDALTLVKDIDALIQGSFIAKANTSKSE